MPGTTAATLARIARRQHGAFSRRQALDAGVSDATILRRVRSKVWIRAHTGVYVDAAARRTAETVAMAACLACGEGAVASHRTAAIVLGLDLPAPPEQEISMPPGLHPDPEGIRVYRPRRLARHEIARTNAIPVTSAMRTLADLARDMDPGLLEIILDAFWRRRSVDPPRLDRYLGEPYMRNRRGTGVLRALASERIGQRPPGSDLETVYIQILKRFRVPLPVRQHPVMTRTGQRFIDLCYPDRRVAVELVSISRHARDRAVFDDDSVRGNELERLGYRVYSFSWTHCVDDPVYVAITTAEAIGLVPARWKPA